MKYMKITLMGHGGYIQPLNELHTAFDGELDGAENDYKKLPEFAGH
jgi:hypothetical protein